MGAGTTGRVANKFNRRFVGYDVKVYWFDIRVEILYFLIDSSSRINL